MPHSLCCTRPRVVRYEPHLKSVTCSYRLTTSTASAWMDGWDTAAATAQSMHMDSGSERGNTRHSALPGHTRSTSNAASAGRRAAWVGPYLRLAAEHAQLRDVGRHGLQVICQARACESPTIRTQGGSHWGVIAVAMPLGVGVNHAVGTSAKERARPIWAYGECGNEGAAVCRRGWHARRHTGVGGAWQLACTAWPSQMRLSLSTHHTRALNCAGRLVSRCGAYAATHPHTPTHTHPPTHTQLTRNDEFIHVQMPDPLEAIGLGLPASTSQPTRSLPPPPPHPGFWHSCQQRQGTASVQAALRPCIRSRRLRNRASQRRTPHYI